MKTIKLAFKYAAIYFVVVWFGLWLQGCTTAPQITKWTSPDLRVAVDPMGIDPANYSRIEEALVSTGKFFVIDRGSGFRAVTKEQDHVNGREYGSYEKTATFDRYGDSDRYARIGKLYGVGSIIVAQTRCGVVQGFFSNRRPCKQYLALVNAVTAEVVAAVSGESDDGDYFYGEVNSAPSWDNTVAKLIDQMPKDYQPNLYDKRMRNYRNEIREESIREKEQRNGDL